MFSRLTSIRSLAAITFVVVILVLLYVELVSSRESAAMREKNIVYDMTLRESRLNSSIQAKTREIENARRLELSLMQPEQVILDESDEFIGQINQWTRKVGGVMSYAEANPQLILPEMHLLDDWDWYSATRGVTLENEADYRKVLAHLRRTAKGKVSSKVNEAFHKYLHDSGGEIPSDPAALLPYIDSPEAEALLRRMSPHTADDKSAGGRDIIFSETVSVDPLFDTAFQLIDRGTGMKYNMPPDTLMRDAIAIYEGEHGSPPSSVEDIRPLMKPPPEGYSGIPEDQLPELFKALMTSFDPTGN